VLVLTAACAIGAGGVFALGLSRRLPEVALLATVLWVVSLLPLTHGLLLSGHLYGPNAGTTVAVMWAVPTALVAGLPLLLDGTAPRRWSAAKWRGWAWGTAALGTLGAAALLILLDLVPAPVLSREPPAALELGLTPVVHSFIGALDQKDHGAFGTSKSRSARSPRPVTR